MSNTNYSGLNKFTAWLDERDVGNDTEYVVSNEKQQTSLETINFEPNTVFCEGVHPYCFRSGKVSQVVSIEQYNNRTRFHVKFDDGIEYFIPLIDIQNYKVWGNG